MVQNGLLWGVIPTYSSYIDVISKGGKATDGDSFPCIKKVANEIVGKWSYDVSNIQSIEIQRTIHGVDPEVWQLSPLHTDVSLPVLFNCNSNRKCKFFARLQAHH